MTPERRDVVFRREALSHLEALYDYVAEVSSISAAASLIDRILTFCEDLAVFPTRGISRDDIRPGLRTLGYNRRAVVAFVVQERTVVIIGVFYGGRDYEPVLRGDE